MRFDSIFNAIVLISHCFIKSRRLAQARVIFRQSIVFVQHFPRLRSFLFRLLDPRHVACHPHKPSKIVAFSAFFGDVKVLFLACHPFYRLSEARFFWVSGCFIPTNLLKSWLSVRFSSTKRYISSLAIPSIGSQRLVFCLSLGFSPLALLFFCLLRDIILMSVCRDAYAKKGANLL